MTAPYIPNLSHCGIFCRDLAVMKRFYTGVFDMQETDRGVGGTFRYELVFLGGRGDQHHQLVLAGGRAPEAPSTVMQLSFKVATIDHLREARRRGPSARVQVEVAPEPEALEPTPDEMHELRSAREAEKRAQRRAEQERKSAARAERATLRAAEQQRKRNEKEKAAVLKAERAAAKAREREAREQAVAGKDELETRVADEQPAEPDAGKPLSELPLYSWAIEAEDRDSAS